MPKSVIIILPVIILIVKPDTSKKSSKFASKSNEDLD